MGRDTQIKCNSVNQKNVARQLESHCESFFFSDKNHKMAKSAHTYNALFKSLISYLKIKM